jgi:hypothetical protein
MSDYGDNIWGELEVIEYPDDGVVIVGSRTPGQDGEPLFRRFPPEE